MFGGAAFAQVYFAGVLNVLRRAAAGGAHGGSGVTPGFNFGALAEQAAEADRRRRKRELEEQELIDLIVAGLV